MDRLRSEYPKRLNIVYFLRYYYYHCCCCCYYLFIIILIIIIIISNSKPTGPCDNNKNLTQSGYIEDKDIKKFLSFSDCPFVCVCGPSGCCYCYFMISIVVVIVVAVVDIIIY